MDKLSLKILLIVSVIIAGCNKNKIAGEENADKEYKYVAYKAKVKVGQDILYVDIDKIAPEILFFDANDDLDAYALIYEMHCVEEVEKAYVSQCYDSVDIY